MRTLSSGGKDDGKEMVHKSWANGGWGESWANEDIKQGMMEKRW